MGGTSNKPVYTGIDKYPGWIATDVTIVVGIIFVGALIKEGSHGGHHGEGHHDAAHGDAAHGEDHADDHKKEEGH